MGGERVLSVGQQQLKENVGGLVGERNEKTEADAKKHVEAN